VVPTKAHSPILFGADVLALYEGICSDTLRRMISFERSEEFNAWLLPLKDKLGRARIIQRIRSAEHGNFGDCEPVGEGVSEMRVHIGPGYRVYFSRRAEVVYLLLVGGDKSSQKRDIKRAIEMARALDKE
jgi:putative addiction module killer protein